MHGRGSDAIWARTLSPRADADDLRRPRLHERLERCLAPGAARVVLLRAAAGAGKTRLLAAWTDELGAEGRARVAWLRAAPDDEDLFAIRNALSRIDDPAFRGPFSAGAENSSESAAIAEAIAASGSAVVIVIDDVHVVRSPAWGRAVAALAEALPEAALLVLSGRGPGRVPITRLRLEREVELIGDDELACTADELRDHLTRRGHPDVDPAALLQRTGGWFAGIRLAELAHADAPDEPFGAWLAGDAPPVSDYFDDEVGPDLAPDTAALLATLAVPARFTADLADALTGFGDVARTIEDAQRRCLLTTTRVDGEVWHRFAPLARQYFAAKLRARDPDAVARTHRRAAQWFAARGHHAAAIHHAMQSDHPTTTCDTLQRSGLHLVLDGRAAELLSALAGAPAGMRGHAVVRTLTAAARLALGDATTAIAVVPPLPADEDDGGMAARVRAGVALQAAVYRGGIDEALAGLEAIAPTASGVYEVDAFTFLQAAMGELYSGDVAAAHRLARHGLEHARAGGLSAAELQALTVLATTALYRGRLEELLDWCRQADERWAASGCPDDVFYFGTRFWHAWVLAERCDLGAARALAATAAGVVIGGGEHVYVRGALATTALFDVDTTANPRETAIRIVGNLTPERSSPVPPEWIAMTAVPATLALTRLGERGLRDTFIASVSAVLTDAAEPFVMRGLAAVADGDLYDVRETLRHALSGEKAALLPVTLVHGWVAQSAVELHEGNRPAAVESLRLALRLAETERHLLPFRHADGAVRLLLHGADIDVRTHPLVAEVRTMLAADGRTERLTPRELTVLRAIAAGATLREIAERDFVSLNTVKTHVRNAYRKLGTSDRERALAAARSLGYL